MIEILFQGLECTEMPFFLNCLNCLLTSPILIYPWKKQLWQSWALLHQHVRV